MSLWNIIKARWGSGDGEVDEARLDPMTNTLGGITFPHFKVHEGHSFISDFVDEALGDDGTIIIAFMTPAGTKRAHLIVDFVTLVGGDLRIWEGVTWDTGTGALLPILNRKRLAVMTSSALLEDLTATPDFTATDNLLVNVTNLATGGATSIHHFYTWGEKGKIPAGGARDVEEFILKPDTKYAIVFTADGSSNKAQVILNWYEHQDNH